MLPSKTLVRTALALGLAAASLAVPARAEAQTKGAPAAKPADDEATKQRNDGLKLLKAGKFEDARVLLASAYKHKPTWQNAIDLGKAELGAGKHRDAAEHLWIGLRDGGKELAGADRKAAEAAFAQVQDKVAALRFDVRPAGAEVFVGGQSIGKAPIADPIFVAPGQAEVEVKADGYTGMKATKPAEQGQETTVEIELSRAKPPAAAQPQRPPDSLLRGVSQPLFWGGVAGTGAFVVMGSAFAILSAVKSSKSHALEQPDAGCGATCKDQFDALQKARVNFAGASMWSFIGATALLLGTASYTVVTIIKRPALPPVNAGLVITPGQLGATIGGRF